MTTLMLFDDSEYPQKSNNLYERKKNDQSKRLEMPF